MSITGFMLDGSAGASTPEEFSAYKRFSPDGCGNHFDLTPRVISGVPTIREWDMPDSAEQTAAYMARAGRRGGERAVLSVGQDDPQVAVLARGGVAAPAREASRSAGGGS